jgi:hypothetical protein
LAVASLAIPWTIDHARSANRWGFPEGNARATYKYYHVAV